MIWESGAIYAKDAVEVLPEQSVTVLVLVPVLDPFKTRLMCHGWDGDELLQVELSLPSDCPALTLDAPMTRWY